jgi:kynurenine formamidase
VPDRPAAAAENSRRIVDLTHELADGTPGYPGDPGLRLTRAHDHGEQGYRVTELHLGTHVGTHVDVPAHVFEDGDDVVAAGLDALVGPATVVDLGELAPFAEIGPGDVGPLHPGMRLLLRTGWARRFGTTEYHDAFPQITLGLAGHLVDAGVALLGIEQPSLHHHDGLAVHHRLLGAGILVVEGLRLTDLHETRIQLVCLPLPVRGADGCPVRAIAITG